MKKSLSMILFVSFLISGGLSLTAAKNSQALQKVPRSATVAIRLLKAPGLNLPSSRWEAACEFRMIPESNLWSEREKLKEGSTERAGDLVKKATLAKSLGSSAGQTLLLEIPFTAPTLDKLKNQPKDRLAPGQDVKSQVFLFYSIISVHDARLKKTLTIPVSRMWDYANFPDARFEVNVEINDDESYSVRSSSRKTPTITIERRTK